MPDKATVDAYLDQLITRLKARGELKDPRIEAAFHAVPRHLFLPGLPLEVAYSDEAVPVKYDLDGAVLSSVSQPSMIAAMLHQLELRPGDNVLEIGAGSGYTAALMQHIVGPNGLVTTLELDNDMVRQASDNLYQAGMGNRIKLVQADGTMGYAPRASYDRIVVAAGIWDVSPAWEEQLKPKGILVAPIWVDGLQFSASFERAADGSLFSTSNIPCGFVTMRGGGAGPRRNKRFGATPLTFVSNDAEQIDAASLGVLMTSDAEEDYLEYRYQSGDYWNGFMPYLMLNKPAGTIFGLYSLLGDVRAFGIEGHGFALIAPGSACFVPDDGLGKAFCFGGSDALVSVEEAASAWEAAGKPRVDRLRIKLMARDAQIPLPENAHVYPRPHHDLVLWYTRAPQEGRP
jgi:protein-L-isoaspartate(D-aspartate) O-methyltransferase